MADNTILNTGTGGDTVRSLDRNVDDMLTAAPGPKTQVVAIDMGGGGGNPENIVSVMPVADGNADLLARMQAMALQLQVQAAQQGNGFYPIETLGHIGGF
jgi:hypothetical protein